MRTFKCVRLTATTITTKSGKTSVGFYKDGAIKDVWVFETLAKAVDALAVLGFEEV